MRRPLRDRLTFANVVSALALFVALGGTSYATISITGKNVKNSSLTGKDVKNNSLTGKDVKGLKSGDVSDHSLLAKDFKSGQLPAGQKGDQGPVGPTAGTANGDFADPLPNPTDILEQSQITLPTAGKIFVEASIRSASSSCTFTTSGGGASGNCTLTLGLYVDGQPVPKTASAFGNSAASGSTFNDNIQDTVPRSTFGLSATLPAGTHTVQLGAKLEAVANNGNTTGSPGPNPSIATAIVGGIALGG